MPAPGIILPKLLLMLAMVCPAAAAATQPAVGPAAHSAKTNRRIVHHFDFDERGEGNLEELPRHWSAIHGEGFPRFARGSFDDHASHLSPKSFHIESMGRDVAFQYNGPEISVWPENEYRVEGFVWTRGFRAARFCVSAHFLDADRRPLLSTSRRTPYLAQPDEAGWTVFELQLPAAPEGAQSLGLVAWILQDATWNPDPNGQAISLVDVAAQAWLDDISVYRLPRVEIETRTPGNIVNPSEAALWVTLADSLDPQLTGELTVVSTDGTEVLRRPIRCGTDHGREERVDLSALGPGLYEARIEVVEQERTIVSRSIRLIVQAPLSREATRFARSFGIVLDHVNRVDFRTESALLIGHSARSVKIPVWAATSGSNGETSEGARALEQYYKELARNQFSLNGVLSFPEGRATAQPAPSQVESPASMPKSSGRMNFNLTDIEGPAINVFRSWQIGADGQSAFDDRNNIEATAAQLQTVLQDADVAPRLAIPLVAHDDLRALEFSAKHATLAVNDQSDLYDLADKIEALRGKGFAEVSVFAPPLRADRFARSPRLTEWTRRVLEARHAGADVVYIPQPWAVRHSVYGSMVEPYEEYLLFRTIGRLLGDAKPGPVVAIAEHVRCLTFRRETGCTVAIWDEAPPLQGRTLAIQLGQPSRQVDLWGNAMPLRHDQTGKSMVTISAMPVLIDQVDNEVIDFISSVSLEPAQVESGAELVRHQIIIDCSDAILDSGEGMLMPPPGVEVAPRTFSFAACAGEPVRIPIQVRYAHNEASGKKKFTARITLSKSGYQFEIPMTVEVRMSEMKVSGRAIIDGGHLLLRQTVQNHSQNVVSFRGVAAVPGRQRQYRPIANLQPGETHTVEYRFADAAALIGRKVSLTLRELNDGPRQHNLELTVP